MVKNRRRHTAAFKFRVAPEALEGSKTISQLSSEHEIYANLIRAWKRKLLEAGPSVKRQTWLLPRSSTPTRAYSSQPMPSPPACSQPTFKSASMAAAAPAHPLIHHQSNPNVPLQFSTQTRPTPSTQNNHQKHLHGLHDQTHPSTDLDLEPHSHRNLPMGRIPPDCIRNYTPGRNSVLVYLTPLLTTKQEPPRTVTAYPISPISDTWLPIPCRGMVHYACTHPGEQHADVDHRRLDGPCR